jgi:neurofibromin 1
MERATNKPFEIVIDLTLFGPSNEVSNQWINQILQLLPFDCFENVGAVHLYNPNTYLRKYMKKLTQPIPSKLSKRLTFAVTLAELHEYILPSEVRLPKSTSKTQTQPIPSRP